MFGLNKSGNAGKMAAPLIFVARRSVLIKWIWQLYAWKIVFVARESFLYNVFK